MSVFKICKWWSAQCPDTLDCYDSFSLLCCRFGLSDNEKDYIVVGSHSGHLSIFYPNNSSTIKNETDSNTNHNEIYDDKEGHNNPADLILETKLKSPILGLLVGKFTGYSKDDNMQQLAVLHPTSLCIYSLTKTDIDHEINSTLRILIEHKFMKSTFSMCKGHFGQVKGREFLCITHMDGNLTFCEQDGIVYECTIASDNSLPSFLCYVPRTDSFVRINSCWELECFRYQDLSQSSFLKTSVSPSWSFCIGEYALDIAAAQLAETKTVIIILGEHNIFCVTDEGKLEFIIRLDYSPKCFCVFVLGWYLEPNVRLITAVISESSSLLIYDESRLIWAAQYDQITSSSIVAFKRSNLNNLPGALVTLNSNGLIHVGFLGSEPHQFKVPPLNLQQIDHASCYDELMKLENELKKSIEHSNQIDLASDLLLKKYLEIDFIIDKNSLKEFDETEAIDNDEIHKNEDEIQNNNMMSESISKGMMCLGGIKFTTKIPLELLQISLVTSDGIKCTRPNVISFHDIPINHTEIIDDIWFYQNEKIPICTNKVEAIISFTDNKHTPRIVTRLAFLPMKMFYKLTTPQQDASTKLTLTLNIEQFKIKNDLGNKNTEENAFSNQILTPILPTVFDDFEIDFEDKSEQPVGFELISSNEIITVIPAKNSNRLRIQSNSLESMALILEIIKYSVEKLEIYQTKGIPSRKYKKTLNSMRKPKSVLILTPSVLPIQRIISVVKNHHEAQEKIHEKMILMDLLWNQFKLFQRSLKSKKENEPIDGILMLIEKNYEDLVTEGDQLVIAQENKRKLQSDLSCVIALLHHLINGLHIDNSVSKILLSTFVYPIDESVEQTWEQSVSPVFELLNQQGIMKAITESSLQSNASIDLSKTFDFKHFENNLKSILTKICNPRQSDMKPNILRKLHPKSTKKLQNKNSALLNSNNSSKGLFEDNTIKTADISDAIGEESLLENNETHEIGANNDRNNEDDESEDKHTEENNMTDSSNQSDWLNNISKYSKPCDITNLMLDEDSSGKLLVKNDANTTDFKL